ncbi:MAG: chorismate synthase [Myxococcaceae bacterium]
MPGNSFGQLFRITTFGESHGLGIGVVIDGCPPGLEINQDLIQKDLNRRRPGQSAITTQRQEKDRVEIISGVYEGKSTGAPICAWIKNEDQRSQDYEQIKQEFRPSHADYTYQAKYGHRDPRGGGRSSARETAARVIAGSIAKMLLAKQGVQINAFVSQVGHIRMKASAETADTSLIESNLIRCPEPETAKKMLALIEEIRDAGDTIGGVVTGVIKNCPVGFGEPVFDRLHADLGKAMLSINAVKGFDYGSGFHGIGMKGSEHNDEFIEKAGKISTKTNYSGGIQGGISNGMDIYFRVAFKPVATLLKNHVGRHDPCVLPRAVPIVEAMAALVLADHSLRSLRCDS